jgi:predicted nucleotide-binding protein
MDKLELLNSLRDDASTKLPHRQSDALAAFQSRAQMVIRKVFGDSSHYLEDCRNIKFFPGIAFSGMRDSVYDEAWTSGKNRLIALCKTMIEDLQLSEPAKPASATPKHTRHHSNRIFVVHGHDEEMKLAVARFLEKLDLTPIILHEQPDKGRTVIEKFLDYSDVGFAIVLLSPDDMGYPKEKNPNAATPRARQNVILELGFFLGKLARQQVLALHKQVPDFDMPTDYAGVLFKPFDAHGAWRFELIKELKAFGYHVDANKVV